MHNFDEFATLHNLELRRDGNYVLLKYGREPDRAVPALRRLFVRAHAATYFSNIPEKRIAQNWFGVEEEDPSA